MTLRMRDDQSVEKNQPSPSTSSITHTTGAIATRNGSPIKMKSARGRIYQIAYHLATLPKLQHPNNRPPLQHLYQYHMQPPLKQQWLQFVRNRARLHDGQGNGSP